MTSLLHTKSHYSLGDGCAPVADLVDCAAARGYAALALTDVENMYGQMQFHRAARARGITPITGVVLFLRRGGLENTRGTSIEAKDGHVEIQ